jgi:hypothetical protein
MTKEQKVVLSKEHYDLLMELVGHSFILTEHAGVNQEFTMIAYDGIFDVCNRFKRLYPQLTNIAPTIPCSRVN